MLGCRPPSLLECSRLANHGSPTVSGTSGADQQRPAQAPGEPALRTALSAYVDHFHSERNHQGRDNLLLFPQDEARRTGPVRCRERLGGLLKFYYRAAA